MLILHLEEQPVLLDKLMEQIPELVMRAVTHHKTMEPQAEEEALQWEELQQLLLEQVEREELEQLTVLQLLDTPQLLMQAEEVEVVR